MLVLWLLAALPLFHFLLCLFQLCRCFLSSRKMPLSNLDHRFLGVRQPKKCSICRIFGRQKSHCRNFFPSVLPALLPSWTSCRFWEVRHVELFRTLAISFVRILSFGAVLFCFAQAMIYRQSFGMISWLLPLSVENSTCRTFVFLRKVVRWH